MEIKEHSLGKIHTWGHCQSFTKVFSSGENIARASITVRSLSIGGTMKGTTGSSRLTTELSNQRLLHDYVVLRARLPFLASLSNE